MPTVELDIRQLADEGGTAPIAPITVTDAVLDEDGNTLTDTLDELKSGLTNSLTFTPASGVTVSHSSIGAFNGLAYGSLEVNLTATANTWKNIGTLSKRTSDDVIMPCVRTGNGTLAGMVKVESSNVMLYPTQQLSSNAIGFTFAFKTSD